RTWRDRFNDDTRTDRYRIWERLFDIPSETIATYASQIAETFRSKMEEDFVDAIHFLELLSYHGLHDEAVALAQEAYDLTPAVKSQSYARRSYRLSAISERVASALCRQISIEELNDIIRALHETKEDDNGEEE